MSAGSKPGDNLIIKFGGQSALVYPQFALGPVNRRVNTIDSDMTANRNLWTYFPLSNEMFH